MVEINCNPFKLMRKVLTFAWKNKYPFSCNAYAYCEENTPSHLDLDKMQYGGPFTTEEVHAVKPFFRLISSACYLFWLLEVDLAFPIM